MTDRPARLLLVHRYYHPDAPPYATMLRVIAQRLAADGHDVQVLSSMPTYNETTTHLRPPPLEVEEGVSVRRLRLPRERKDMPVQRAVLAVLFVLAVFAEILRRRPDLVTFSTMPPVLLGMAVRIGMAMVGRRGRYLYHCQDLYPEATWVGGRSPGPVARLAMLAERGTRRHAAAVVVLSRDMKDTVVAGGARPERTHVINNFSMVEPTTDRPPMAGRRPRVVFAGNLGRFQQLDTIADAVRTVRSREVDVEWLFLGDGPGRPILEAVEGDDVELRGYVPPAEAFAHLQRCDIGLVTLREGMLDVAYPSKTMTYLAAGCQVLTTAPRSSDLGRVIDTHGVGCAVGADDRDELADAVVALADRASDTVAARCRDTGRELFGRDAVMARWCALVADLVGA